ncbi:MAG: lysozyme [Sphingobacteriia bacterium]|nr:lysozyme [Sphingobacteriia bacterium]
MYEIDEKATSFIKQFEGLSLTPYTCPAGIRTIGYGHVITQEEQYKPDSFQKITNDEADRILENDLNKIRDSIFRNIYAPLTHPQFIAILSFTFNVGGGALQRSSLRQKINRLEHETVPFELNKWVFASGRKLPGLIKRRYFEGLMYKGII